MTFVLPDGSPPGNYSVRIGHSPDSPKPLAWANGLSKSNGVDQQVTVELNLSDVAAGDDYYLWTVVNNDQPTIYYPLRVRSLIDPADTRCGF